MVDETRPHTLVYCGGCNALLEQTPGTTLRGCPCNTPGGLWLVPPTLSRWFLTDADRRLLATLGITGDR